VENCGFFRHFIFVELQSVENCGFFRQFFFVECKKCGKIQLLFHKKKVWTFVEFLTKINFVKKESNDFYFYNKIVITTLFH
jgi:hypothetical protein